MSQGRSHPTIDAVLAQMGRNLRSHPQRAAMVESGPLWWRRLGLPSRAISCGELARRIAATTRGLEVAGVSVGDAVLFAVRSGIDSIVLMAALLRVGANVVALDPGVGPQLFASRLKAIRPSWVVAESIVFLATSGGPLRRFLRRFGLEVPNIHVEGARFVRVGRRWPGVPRSVSLASLCRIGGDDEPHTPQLAATRIVLTIFTSGTTAQPKAVLHTSASLGAAIDIIAAHMRLDETHVVYSAQTHQMLAALLAGAVCVVAPHRPDAARFIADVTDYRATHAYAVPFEMATVVHELERRGGRLPAHLHTLVLGSAPVLRDFLLRLRTLCDDSVDVWCAYAMTELFPAALVESREKLAYTGEGDLIGTPVEGVSASTAGDGELMVRGPHLYHRYLGHDPADQHATGDLASIGPDGRIVMLGRKKDMIIRGHYNIYPALYEPEVAAIDGVAACAMVGVSDAHRADERIVLAVQPAPGVDPVALRKRIETAIRDGSSGIDPFAQPDRVLICDLPRSGRSLKLDRRALVEMVAFDRGNGGA